MAYRIEQNAIYAPRRTRDRWRWSVWIDGTDEELDAVDEVTWYLHPTFPNPVRAVSDRSTGFRIESSGWGVFDIGCEIARADGSRQRLSHSLRFESPTADVKPPRKGADGAVVFLAYPSETAGEVLGVKRRLAAMGVDVRDVNDLEAGVPMKLAVKRMLESSHAMVAIQDAYRPSEFVDRERSRAADLGIATMEITVGGPAAATASTESPSNVSRIELADFVEGDVTDRILGFLNEA